MNENERAPAETAADYAVHFADGFFVPCPCCGKEVESPDNGFTSEKEAMEWALGACDCAGAKAWQQQRPALRMDSPCVAGKMKAGRCGHTAYTAHCTEFACSAYHPELYAPELYARAFDLYAKRKADEKATEDAQVLASNTRNRRAAMKARADKKLDEAVSMVGERIVKG